MTIAVNINANTASESINVTLGDHSCFLSHSKLHNVFKDISYMIDPPNKVLTECPFMYSSLYGTLHPLDTAWAPSSFKRHTVHSPRYRTHPLALFTLPALFKNTAGGRALGGISMWMCGDLCDCVSACVCVCVFVCFLSVVDKVLLHQKVSSVKQWLAL